MITNFLKISVLIKETFQRIEFKNSQFKKSYNGGKKCLEMSLVFVSIDLLNTFKFTN